MDKSQRVHHFTEYGSGHELITIGQGDLTGRDSGHPPLGSNNTVESHLDASVARINP